MPNWKLNRSTERILLTTELGFDLFKISKDWRIKVTRNFFCLRTSIIWLSLEAMRLTSLDSRTNLLFFSSCTFRQTCAYKSCEYTAPEFKTIFLNKLMPQKLSNEVTPIQVHSPNNCTGSWKSPSKSK